MPNDKTQGIVLHGVEIPARHYGRIEKLYSLIYNHYTYVSLSRRINAKERLRFDKLMKKACVQYAVELDGQLSRWGERQFNTMDGGKYAR